LHQVQATEGICIRKILVISRMQKIGVPQRKWSTLIVKSF